MLRPADTIVGHLTIGNILKVWPKRRPRLSEQSTVDLLNGLAAYESGDTENLIVGDQSWPTTKAWAEDCSNVTRTILRGRFKEAIPTYFADLAGVSQLDYLMLPVVGPSRVSGGTARFCLARYGADLILAAETFAADERRRDVKLAGVTTDEILTTAVASPENARAYWTLTRKVNYFWEQSEALGIHRPPGLATIDFDTAVSGAPDWRSARLNLLSRQVSSSARMLEKCFEADPSDRSADALLSYYRDLDAAAQALSLPNWGSHGVNRRLPSSISSVPAPELVGFKESFLFDSWEANNRWSAVSKTSFEGLVSTLKQSRTEIEVIYGRQCAQNSVALSDAKTSLDADEVARVFAREQEWGPPPANVLSPTGRVWSRLVTDAEANRRALGLGNSALDVSPAYEHFARALRAQTVHEVEPSTVAPDIVGKQAQRAQLRNMGVSGGAGSALTDGKTQADKGTLLRMWPKRRPELSQQSTVDLINGLAKFHEEHANKLVIGDQSWPAVWWGVAHTELESRVRNAIPGYFADLVGISPIDYLMLPVRTADKIAGETARYCLVNYAPTVVVVAEQFAALERAEHVDLANASTAEILKTAVASPANARAFWMLTNQVNSFWRSSNARGIATPADAMTIFFDDQVSKAPNWRSARLALIQRQLRDDADGLVAQFVVDPTNSAADALLSFYRDLGSAEHALSLPNWGHRHIDRSLPDSISSVSASELLGEDFRVMSQVDSDPSYRPPSETSVQTFKTAFAQIRQEIENVYGTYCASALSGPEPGKPMEADELARVFSRQREWGAPPDDLSSPTGIIWSQLVTDAESNRRALGLSNSALNVSPANEYLAQMLRAQSVDRVEPSELRPDSAVAQEQRSQLRNMGINSNGLGLG